MCDRCECEKCLSAAFPWQTINWINNVLIAWYRFQFRVATFITTFLSYFYQLLFHSSFFGSAFSRISDINTDCVRVFVFHSNSMHCGLVHVNEIQCTSRRGSEQVNPRCIRSDTNYSEQIKIESFGVAFNRISFRLSRFIPFRKFFIVCRVTITHFIVLFFGLLFPLVCSHNEITAKCIELN